MGPYQLISIGYEGRDISSLIEQLRANHVQVLVDVRLNPISRKPGLSKTKLAEALHNAGILYVHHRELGNPKANRDAFRSGSGLSRGFPAATDDRRRHGSATARVRAVE